LEPRPNHYDFSEFDKLLEVANHYDLSVVLNTVIESQPFWIHRLFPQAYMIDQYGSPILSTTGEYSSGLSPGTCLDHLGPRVQAEKFLTSIANHFKDEENLLCWDAWNEFRWFDNIYDMSRGESIEHSRIPCYCDKTIEKFRIWLKNKYDSLVGLNERWRRTYIDWVDVFPPRGGWFSYAYPEMVDWRNFIIEYVIDKLEFRVNAIRKGDSLHPIMTHSMNSSIRNPEILCYAGSDDWKNSRVVDLYGTSFYPSWDQSGGTDLDQNFLCLDGLRCASGDKEFWIAELQGGPSFHSPGKATNYYPQDIHFWTYSALSHGAKGILYWSWDPEPLGPEALGFGLTLIDGTPTPRAKMVKNLSQVIERNKSLFARSKPVSSKVAILFDPDLFIINCFGGSGGMKRDMVNNSVRGYYRAFWENNISCDFIHSNYLSKIKNYKLLILPFVFCLKLKTAHVIKDYIRNGGIVVSEAYFGRFKEGFLPAETSPPYGL
jgi:beta-galactosidase